MSAGVEPTSRPVRVGVAGASGRMGREVVRAVHGEPECELAAAVDVQDRGVDAGLLAGVGPTGVLVRGDLTEALVESRADVLVDFTLAEAAWNNALAAVGIGVSPVIGTTGLSAEQLKTLDENAREAQVGAFVAPNFAIGAVLLMLFSRQAARYMPEAEIIELHHEKKIDAPSGTAMRTATLILEGRGVRTATRPSHESFVLEGARGGDLDGVRIHSVRLPGFVAHQEVIFGGQGQTLTMRHDSTDRTSFMPGVLLAVKRVRALDGLVVGLEHLMEMG